MYLLILLIPLLSFFSASLFGRFIGRHGSTLITTCSLFLTAFLSTLAFYEVAIAEANCFIRLVP
jgi:NADH-quinone oxidoreductase subunit L